MRIRSRNLEVVDHPELSLTADFLGKSLLVLTEEGRSEDQIRTATSFVSSVRPYKLTELIVHALSSKPVSRQWIAQKQCQPLIGNVIVYPDSEGTLPRTVENCAIIHIDPDAHDGADRTVTIVTRGTSRNLAAWGTVTRT